MTFRPLVLLAVLPMVAGCENPEHLSPDFGDAVRFNMAAQIVNPAPQVGALDPTFDGDLSAGAYERYRTGTVRKPEARPSSKIGGGK